MDKPNDPVIPAQPLVTPAVPTADPVTVAPAPASQEPVPVVTPAPTTAAPAPSPNPIPVQTQIQQPNAPVSSSPTMPPVAEPIKAATPIPNQSPSMPASFAPRKEAGAVGETKPAEFVAQPNWAEADKVAKEENDEYWEKFAAEIEGEKKVLEVGGLEKIEKGEAVVSPQLAQEMGIKPVEKPPEADNNQSNFSVRGVSFSDDQISAGMKAPSGTGVRWLVEWFVLQLLKAHFHIKKTWGGVVERSL